MCTDALVLEDVNEKLECVMDNMRRALPAADGLVVRPAIKERIKQRNVKTARRYSSLPLYHKRGRKRSDNKYRNRVGKRADQLRKVQQDATNHCLFTVISESNIFVTGC